MNRMYGTHCARRSVVGIVVVCAMVALSGCGSKSEETKQTAVGVEANDTGAVTVDTAANGDAVGVASGPSDASAPVAQDPQGEDPVDTGGSGAFAETSDASDTGGVSDGGVGDAVGVESGASDGSADAGAGDSATADAGTGDESFAGEQTASDEAIARDVTSVDTVAGAPFGLSGNSSGGRSELEDILTAMGGPMAGSDISCVEDELGGSGEGASEEAIMRAVFTCKPSGIVYALSSWLFSSVPAGVTDEQKECMARLVMDEALADPNFLQRVGSPAQGGKLSSSDLNRFRRQCP